MPTERSIVLFQKKELCLLYSSCLFGSDLSIALSLTVLQILTDFRQTSTCGDQLTNDDVLLQAGQRVDLALDGSCRSALMLSTSRRLASAPPIRLEEPESVTRTLRHI